MRGTQSVITTDMPEPLTKPRKANRRSEIDGRYIRVDEWLKWRTYWTPTEPHVPSAEPIVNGVGHERCGGCGENVLELFELPALGTTSAIYSMCLECAGKMIRRQAHPLDDDRYCPTCGFPWVASNGDYTECMFGHVWNKERKRCNRKPLLKRQ